MADEPISGLPETTSVTGNEFIPIVQNGVTKKIKQINLVPNQASFSGTILFDTNITLAVGYIYLEKNTNASARSLTIPSATGNTGKFIFVAKQYNNGYNIGCSGGGISCTLTKANDSVLYICDGSSWQPHLNISNELLTEITNKVTSNTLITGSTKTKITYDSKGLVTSGADATTADIAETTNKNYQTDNQKLYNDATSSIQTQLDNRVPYTGANSNVELDTYSLNAKSLHVKGTGGAGHLGLKHQSSNITASASESSIGADISGNPVWKNDGNTLDYLQLKSEKDVNTGYVGRDSSGGLSIVDATITSTTASTLAFISSAKKIISATGALLGTWFQTLTADTNPVDADTIIVNDSTASFEAKKVTWANIKATLLLYFNTTWFSTLTSNFIGYWDGSKFIDSQLRRVTGAGFTSTTAFRNVGLLQAFNQDATIENALAVYKNVNTAGKYNAQYIDSNSAGLEILANQAPTGNSSLNDYALRVRNYSSLRYIAWLESFDKTASEATLTGVDSGTVIISRRNDINTTNTQYYGTGIYISIKPSTNSSFDKYGTFKLVLQEVGNNKGAWQWDMQGVRLATLNQDGQLTLGTGLPNSSAQLDLQATTKGFLVNRLTTSQKTAISSPANGLQVYDTDLATDSNYTTRNSINAWIDSKIKFSELFDPFLIDQQIAPSGVVYVARFKPKSDMIITAIEFIVTAFTSSETYYVGVYNTALTSKLTDGSASITSSGEKQISVTPIKLTGATTYYLVLKDNNGGTLSVGASTSYANTLICSSKFIGSGALPADLTSGGSPTADTKAPYLGVISL